MAPAAVRVIDLESPVADLVLRRGRTGARYQSLLAVACREGRPLTTATFAVGFDERVASGRLVEGLRERLSEQPSGTGTAAQNLPHGLMSAMTPHVSVVIPTCANPEPLERCLRSVLASNYTDFEVIVVENRPAVAHTAEMLERRFSGEKRIRLVEEPRAGASHARNAGLAQAAGELVAFTDDDVVVESGWLRASVEALLDSDDVVCVAGLILPIELESESQLLMEQFASFGKGFRRKTFRLPESRLNDPLFPYTAGSIGSGASTLIQADIARELGGFDPMLGPGTPTTGGEDLEIFIRVLRAGYAVAYEPGAVVWHRHPDGMPRLRRQVYKYGVGLGAMLTKQLIVGPERSDFLRSVPAGVRYARDADSRKNAGKPANYPWYLTWFERVGMTLGPIAYVLSVVLAALRGLAGGDVQGPFRPARSIRHLKLARGGVIRLAWFSTHARSLRERQADSALASSRSIQLIRAAALGLCLVAPLAVSFGAPDYVRLPVVLALFCLVPGLALLTATGTRPEPGLVIGISVAATELVALTMVWLGVWWPTVLLYLLAALCAVPLRAGLRASGALGLGRSEKLQGRAPPPRRAAAQARAKLEAIPRSTRTHASVIGLALLVWGLSLTTTQLGGIGGAGLLDVLPPDYFLALALMLAGFAVAASRPDTERRVLGAYVFGLILILYGTTALLYEEPRYSWVYKHFGVINLIGATGSADRGIDIYNNWPAFFAANAWLSRTTGVAPIVYAGFAQVFFNVFNVLALRFALRAFTRDERLLWTASLMFVLGNWVGQDYLSPQACAFALSLTVLGLCLRCGSPGTAPRSRLGRSLVARGERLTDRVLPPRMPVAPDSSPPLGPKVALLIGAGCTLAVITTHQLSPVLLIMDVAAITVLTRRIPLWVPAAMAVLELWWLSLAFPFVSRHFTLIQVGTDHGAAAAGRNLAAAPPGATASFYAPAIVMLLMVALAGVGLVRRLRAGHRDLVLVGFIVAPVLVVAVQPYGGEGPYRAFLFALPWLAFLGAAACARGGGRRALSAMSGRRLALVSPVLAVCLLFALFGQELANHVLTGDVQASTWYEQNAPAGSLRINLAPNAPDRLTARYPLVSLSDPQSLMEDPGFAGHRLGAADIPRLERVISQQGPHPVYVVLTRGQENYARLNGLLPTGSVGSFVAALRSSSAFALVFSRPGAWIFRYTGGRVATPTAGVS